MEEPPRQRDRGDLVTYALIIALAVIVVIGVLIVLRGPNTGSIFTNINNGL